MPGVTSQIADGACLFASSSPVSRYCRKHHIERARGEPHHPRRHALDDGVLDAVERWASRFPVIGLRVSLMDWFCLYSTSRPPMAASASSRGHMAGIDCPTAGNQHQEAGCGCWVEGDLESPLVVDGRVLEDREAGIGAQFFRRFLHQQIVRALDVHRNGWPSNPDALTQLEGQPVAVCSGHPSVARSGTID